MTRVSIESVLLVEDNPGDARLLHEMLREQSSHGIELTLVNCMDEAEKHIAGHAVDIILLDLGLPDVQGLEAVRRAHAAAPGVPLVVLTGLDDESLPAQALQEGAQDYLIKGQIETRGLLRALRYAVERKRLERLKDEFVSTVSHELRTPLTSIAGSLGLLMNKTAGDLRDPAARLLAIAHTNTQRLVRLVNDILDIEKMESRQVVFNLQRVDVRPLVDQTIEANRVLAEASGVRIRVEGSGIAGAVRADPDRLAQVVTNLLSNAIKFSPTDSEVVVAIAREAEALRISVRDHGPGISADFKPRIFERFAQADATNTRQKGGTGLGLSIVKQIVDRLGGQVGFADAPGGGTIFYVDLPGWTASGLSGAEDVRILLCESDPDVALALSDRLRQTGFHIEIALTAKEAITRAAAASYAAILVDLQLLDHDGIALIKQLRAQTKIDNMLLVVSSVDANPAIDGPRSSTLLNILDWLDTPVDLIRLVETLDRSIADNGSKLPRILHFDDDRAARVALAKALEGRFEVVSAASIFEMRCALAAEPCDVVVLDIAHVMSSGADLLRELRDSEGDAVPLILFSPAEVNPIFAARIKAALIKSHTSMDELVATLRKHIARTSSTARRGREAA